MQPDDESLAAAYDRYYRRPDYFGDRQWLYRPYIKALARKAGLAPGFSILDAGCGQGFFTRLFADLGMAAVGADISAEGIRAAKRQSGSSGERYVVGDVRNLEFSSAFDCVFTRSCSLYNNRAFADLSGVTDRLLTYVKPGGVFIFDYYTRLSPWKKSPSWIYHSLPVVQKHFSRYPRAEVFFSLRLDAIFLGSATFSSAVSLLSATISRCCGVGGELVAIVRKARVS